VITTCSCPAGTRQCAGSNNSFLCQSDFNRDSRRCGIDCLDCDRTIPGSVCCEGRCTHGAAPSSFGGLGPCPGNGCEPCPGGLGCCGRPGVCQVLDNIGRCPGPGV
jgi:hypothetical protein